MLFGIHPTTCICSFKKQFIDMEISNLISPTTVKLLKFPLEYDSHSKIQKPNKPPGDRSYYSMDQNENSSMLTWAADVLSGAKQTPPHILIFRFFPAPRPY